MRRSLLTAAAVATLLAVLSCAGGDGPELAVTAPIPASPVNPPRNPPASPPTIPPTTPPRDVLGSIWGYVVDDSGRCLPDVSVEIVTGPGAGRRMRQVVPCGMWDYGNGWWFVDLPLGPVTIRVSSPGYRTQDFELTARSGGYADILGLERVQ